MQRELSYVRDGVLNRGAIDFQIPISNGLDSLHFLWWNGDFSSTVNYKIMVEIKNNSVMFQPSLNISHSGQIPKIPTYWRMSLPCQKGQKGSTQVEILFDLGPNLKFKLTRLKFCQDSEHKMLPNQEVKTDRTSSHLVFVYSLFFTLFLALFLAIFVGLMQRKFSSEMGQNNIVKEDPSPLLPAPPANCDNFCHQMAPPANPGFSIYDGGLTSDAESRVTDWIQQQYMKANSEVCLHLFIHCL